MAAISGLDGDVWYQGDAKAGGHHLDQGAKGCRLKGFIANRVNDAAGLQGVAAKAMAVLHHQQLHTGEVVAGDAVASAQRMVARHRHQDRVFRNLHRFDIAQVIRPQVRYECRANQSKQVM